MNCPNPIYIRRTRLNVPCGKCSICRKRRALDWVIRLQEEEKASRSVYFVTLTYNEHTVPLLKDGRQTLVKKDLQDFINSLRQIAPFRYFAIGEYGEKGERPHYHLLLFNFIPIVDPKKKNVVYHKNYDKITTDMLMANVDVEGIILKAWKKGIVQVQPMDGGAIGYLANYCVDPTVKADDDLQQSVFALMSKKPPIGYQYYQNKQTQYYHRQGIEKMHYTNNGYRVALPRIYKNKLYTQREREAYNEMIQQKEAREFQMVRDLKRYTKNRSESIATKLEKNDKRLKNRSL